MTDPVQIRAEHGRVTDAEWRAVGRELAGIMRDHVVLLTSSDLAALGAVALGLAAAAGDERRVAVFDLAGAFGRDDDDGLVLAFRDGRSLNAIARPIEATSMEHFLVPRGPGELTSDFAAHERWPRLINGFRATGSLLILLVAVDDHVRSVAVREYGSLADRLAELAERSFALTTRAGIAALLPIADRPPDRSETQPGPARRATPIAALPAPTATPIEHERVLPRTTPARSGPAQTGLPEIQAAVASAEATSPPARAHRRWERSLVLVVLVAAALTGEWIWSRGQVAADDGVLALPTALAAEANATRAAAPDTVSVPNVVNPQDADRAAAWGVELRVTNDRDEARFLASSHGALPAVTLSTLWLDLDPLPWHSVIVGAVSSRDDAVSFRTSLRRAGVIGFEDGVIAQVPFALRIDAGLTPSAARARVSQLLADSVYAYALRADDGTASVYAGAFALPEQSVHLLVELRRKNLNPVFAYRVGRTF